MTVPSTSVPRNIAAAACVYPNPYPSPLRRVSSPLDPICITRWRARTSLSREDTGKEYRLRRYSTILQSLSVLCCARGARTRVVQCCQGRCAQQSNIRNLKVEHNSFSSRRCQRVCMIVRHVRMYRIAAGGNRPCKDKTTLLHEKVNAALATRSCVRDDDVARGGGRVRFALAGALA